MRCIAIALLTAAAGCATSVSQEKMTWAEVMPVAAPAPALRKVDPRADASFASALQRFAEAAQASRKTAVSGAAMPDAQVEAWATVLAQVDAFLSKSPKQSSAMDAARARVVVQGALELDAQAYGDIPLETALSAQAAAKKLTARIGELVALHQMERVSPRHFRWPVTPVVVTSPFGDRLHPITGEYRVHRGVDLLAELKQPVHAAFAGTVVFSGWNGGHGKQVQLQHDGHWGTHYSHLSAWWVQPGDVVTKGQVIGIAGSTGESTGPHVHFELVHDGETVDPEAELPEPPGTGLPMALQ